MISFSLWEMKRMLLPSAARFFMICISSSISCGVRTAVGSSKISTSQRSRLASMMVLAIRSSL